MKTRFKIQGMVNLGDGTVVLTGEVQGRMRESGTLLCIGQFGFAATNGGKIKVQIIGVGVGDRDLKKANMEMVQVRILEGDRRLLKGATLQIEQVAQYRKKSRLLSS
jgi:hypothetical protein